MKLTVLIWLRDSLIGLIGRTIEILFRIILCLMPLGIYLLLIQFRSKASKISSISVFTTDDSIWQHIFPGFILVAINPNVLKENYKKTKKKFQNWVNENKYMISFTFMTLITILLLWLGR